jgi:hypothetical protein
VIKTKDLYSVKKNKRKVIDKNRMTTIKYKLQTYNNMHSFYTRYKL